MDRSKPMERTAIQGEVGPVEELCELLEDILKVMVMPPSKEEHVALDQKGAIVEPVIPMVEEVVGDTLPYFPHITFDETSCETEMYLGVPQQVEVPVVEEQGRFVKTNYIAVVMDRIQFSSKYARAMQAIMD